MPLYFRMNIPNPKVTIIGYKWFAINLSSSHSFNANIFSPLLLCQGPDWCRAGGWRQLIVCIYPVSIMYLYLSCIYHVSRGRHYKLHPSCCPHTGHLGSAATSWQWSSHGEIIYGGTRWIEDDCSATFSEYIFLFPACLMISHWLTKNAELNSVF